MLQSPGNHSHLQDMIILYLPAFQSQSYVDSWLTNSILPFYKATKITQITVGNKVTRSGDNSTHLVDPAMRNVVSTLKKASLQDIIKVSTSVSFGVVSKAYPPSEGTFDSKFAFVLNPMLHFQRENGSPFMVILYPYYAIDDSSLKYVLFEPSPQAFVDPNTCLRYDNMLDAQLDAVHYAIANQHFKISETLRLLWKPAFLREVPVHPETGMLLLIMPGFIIPT